MPAGTLTTFGPARNLRTLHFANDTLWIGTEGGLFAYAPDADSIVEVKGAAYRSVAAVSVDDAGSLWVGGEAGLSVRLDDVWLHYDPGRHPLFSRVTDITPGDGRMWIGTYGNGCGYVTADSIRSFSRADSLLDDRVLAVAEENRHVIWFGTASGLCMTDTLHWMSMRYGNRIPIGAVTDLLFGEGGDLYLAVERRGAVRVHLGRVWLYGPRDGLPGTEVNAFSLDPRGVVWAAGFGGVSVYDGSGWVPRRAAGLTLEEYRFLSICHDIEGNCYLGTDDGALLVLSRDSGRRIDIPQRFSDSKVTRIRRFGAELWILTNRRIYRLRRGLEEIAPPDDWFIGAMTDCVVDPAGDLWVATRFGILHRTGGQWEVFDRRQGLPTEHFVSAAAGDDGYLWFGTYDRGVLRLSNEGWFHFTRTNGLPDERIADIVVDGFGTPWVVAGEGQLARFDGTAWTPVALHGEPDRDGSDDERDSTVVIDPAIRFLETAGEERTDGSSFPPVSVGLDGAGRCIVAMPEGIYRHTESGWLMIDAPDRGRGVDPTAVLVSSNGRVWLGTAAGGVYVSDRGSWLHIGTGQGLTDDHIFSIAEDADGNLWIGTRYGGLNRFTPEPVF
jgi:ligand-binding sensor domain-containing protein